MDEEEDEESLLVATRNEENAKVSAVSPNVDSPDEIIERSVMERLKAPSLLKYTYKEGKRLTLSCLDSFSLFGNYGCK